MLGGVKLQYLYNHSSKCQLFWLLYVKVMFHLKYATKCGGKLAYVVQNCQSLKHIPLLGFLEFCSILFIYFHFYSQST